MFVPIFMNSISNDDYFNTKISIAQTYNFGSTGRNRDKLQCKFRDSNALRSYDIEKS